MRWKLWLPAAVTVVAALLAALLVALARERFTISSAILGETRSILVHLPPGYHSSVMPYPVLVHLDANPGSFALEPSFYETARRLDTLGAPVPQMIAIGVVNTRRARDMIPCPDAGAVSAGGAGRFLLFITRELLPAIRTRYRACDPFVLYGRSDSGLFAIYALTDAADAFQAIIASSPSLDRCPAFIADRIRGLFRVRPDLAGTLFVAYGSNERYVSVEVPPFAELIRTSASGNFNLGVASVPDGGHIPRSSLEDGLQFAFSRSATR